MNIDRFHIVIFNYERICSFLDNFHKIVNFNSAQDKVFILDCSRSHKLQQQRVMEFSQQKGWKLGEQIHFIRRKNWGIDQGGRIDYFNLLHQSESKPKYIWQFQEHYLDLDSPWSIFDRGILNIDGRDLGGEIKGDVIPSELIIDLNECEKIYETYPEVSVIYADRSKIGICPYSDLEFFYIDGGNFCILTSYVLKCFDRSLLENLKLIYDSSYNWALFMEFTIGYQLTQTGGEFFDLVTHYHFNSPQQLKQLEGENKVSLHKVCEQQYSHVYEQYKQKYVSIANSKTLNKQFYKLIFQGRVFLQPIYNILKSFKKSMRLSLKV